jgi:hypothetical protein
MNYGCGYVENNYSINPHITTFPILRLRIMWSKPRLSTPTLFYFFLLHS